MKPIYHPRLQNSYDNGDHECIMKIVEQLPSFDRYYAIYNERKLPIFHYCVYRGYIDIIRLILSKKIGNRLHKYS